MQLVGRIWDFLSASRREHNRQRPEVLLTIGRRRGDSEWRAASFSVRNLINQQLLVTEIALVGCFGCRITAAIGEFENWRMDEKRVGRTFRTNHIIRPSAGQTYRQEVPFFLRHPRDGEGAPYSIKLSVMIEHRMDPSRRWQTVLEGQLPQSPADPRIFGPRGAHV